MPEISDYLQKWLNGERESWPRFGEYLNKYNRSHELLAKIPSADEFTENIMTLLKSTAGAGKVNREIIENIFSQESEKSWEKGKDGMERISSGIGDYIDLLRRQLEISDNEAEAVQKYLSDLTDPVIQLLRLPFSFKGTIGGDYRIFNGNKYVKLLRFLDQIRRDDREALKNYRNYTNSESKSDPKLYRDPNRFFGLYTLLLELYGIVNLQRNSVYIYNSRIALRDLGYEYKEPSNFQDLFAFFTVYDKFVAEKYKDFAIDKIQNLIDLLPKSLSDEQKSVLLKHIEVDQFFSSYQEKKKAENAKSRESTSENLTVRSGNAQSTYAKIPRNMILHGPVGTGKTYLAGILASGIIQGKITGMEDIEGLLNGKSGPLQEYERKPLERTELTMVTFHQSYGYEEFIAGIRASTKNGAIMYNVQEGIFMKLCKEAMKHLEKPYVILIDEINRGDISRIFGELITLIEEDKRYVNDAKPGLSLTIPNFNDEGVDNKDLTYKFSVPDNVFIIGTMNDSDRSIALLDAALRRRFTFFNVPPNKDILMSWISEESGIRDMVAKVFEEMNNRITEVKGEDSQIGHAFFKSLNGLTDADESKNELLRIFKYKILPLLKELFYGQDDTLSKKILRGRFLKKNDNSSVYCLNKDELDPNDLDSFIAEFEKLRD